MEKMLGRNWQPSEALAAALHPSTSKDYVWPRYDRVLFSAEHFSLSDGGESVLYNFLRLEQWQLPKNDYFHTVQTEVTVQMRSIVTDWMTEVCKEEGCSCEVFPLAVSYLDRFLSFEAVHKHQLQALGTACLFLASKVKLPRHFDGARLVLYTDGGVSLPDLLSWELLVLNRLNWDIASLTAFDFIDQYLHRLRLPDDQKENLRTSVNFLVAQTSCDFRIAVLPPSVAAAVCLNIGLVHIYGEHHVSFERFAQLLGKTIAVVMDPKLPYSGAVYDLVLRYQAAFAKPRLQPALRQLQLPPLSVTFVESEKNPPSPTDDENCMASSASTPTDIIDVAIF